MKIYIHANCQGTALAKLMTECLPAGTQIKCGEVYSLDLETETRQYFQNIREADIIILQPVADGYRNVEFLASSWIEKNRASNSKLIRIPVIYHRGQLIHSFTMSDIHEGRLAYHDAHALEYFLAGKSLDEFLSETERSDFFSADFVRSECYITTSEIIRRESNSGCDVLVSDIIISLLLNSQPLFSLNHPSRAVLAEVGNRVLRLLGLDYQISIEGPEPLDHYIATPYLSTVLALGHNGNNLRLDEARASYIWESRRNFYREVFDSYKSIGVEALNKSMSKHKEIQAYLNRFHRSNCRKPAEDPRKLIEILYKTFLGRIPSSGDVLHHLQTLEHHGYEALVSAFPKSQEFKTMGGGEALENRFSMKF